MLSSVELPEDAKRYLAHRIYGKSLREIARSESCHPSTVMRQIRKVETRCDDPLYAIALDRMKQQMSDRSNTSLALAEAEVCEALDVLRVLASGPCFLLVNPDLEKAALIDPHSDTGLSRGVERELVEMMRLQTWIAPGEKRSELERYNLTPQGRRWVEEHDDPNSANQGSSRANASIEPPLQYLSRRKDKTGQPWLSRRLVRAGEQLQEDYELSQLAEEPIRDFKSIISGGERKTKIEGYRHPKRHCHDLWRRCRPLGQDWAMSP